MLDLLEHKLVLVIVPAIVAFVLGWFTSKLNRQSDLREKKKDSDNELAVEIVGSDQDLITALQFLLNAPRERHKREGEDKTVELQQKLDDAFSEWKLKSAEIGGKIQTRNSSSSLLTKWTVYKDAVEDLYAMRGIEDSGIQTYADGLSGKLTELFEKNEVERSDRNWATSKDVVQKEKDQIVVDILRNHKQNL